MSDKPSDLDTIREPLGSKTGKAYWRSLDELADTPEFQALLRREYPRYAAVVDSGMDRRQFLKILGASLALAGLSACGIAPAEKIVPYVDPPEQAVPGKPLYYATAMALGGFATGLLVESHMGRPTKVEGNPDHPASLGATDAFAQASVLSLYDPDRSQVITRRGQIATWDDFLREFRGQLDQQRAQRGAGLRILTQTSSSPTLADQIRRLGSMFPQAKWHQYDPAGRDNSREGARLAFGQYVDAVYHVDRAETMLSLDGDLLFDFPGHLRYARDFAAGRRVEPGQTTMNRLYVVESAMTITGAKADHRLPLRAAEIETVARAIAASVGVAGARVENLPAKVPPNWIEAVARDLRQHAGRSLVIAGNTQPPIVHALAHAMNGELGNLGQTVTLVPPVDASQTNGTASLRDLVRDMAEGSVAVLAVLGTNPVYHAPADLAFADQMSKVGFSVHLGLYHDETAELAQWHIPEAHLFEAWSDARAYDGTATIIQPLIAPLYGGRSTHEMVAAMGDAPGTAGLDLVRGYWESQYRGADFDSHWRSALNTGVVPGSAFQPIAPALTAAWANQPVQALPADDASLEITFRLDPTVYDGQFANNGWLQELPKPLTRLTWDAVAVLSPNTARRLGVSVVPGWQAGEHGQAIADLVELTYEGRTERAPVWIMPGQPDDSVTVYLGYGRRRAGRVGTGLGFNAFKIRTSERPWVGTGAQIRKTGERYPLASVQMHHMLEGNDLVRAATLQEFQRNPGFAQEGVEQNPPNIYPEVKYEGYAWGMAIDINTCIGCNACVAACQAENNIPIVGKPEVLRGREMHWLRIDTLFEGDPEHPRAFFEPVPCMHCETAPCEVVCPTAATVHSSEGLNEMVYNRCIGTRYCSNNCPYKVRRFNFLQYADWTTESLKAMRNPDVTVRSRGVMEKCTYCVQRIVRARTEAEKEGRRVGDGEVITACAAACPADAIVFGDINDPNSRVARLKASPRSYALLAELNTRPRTTYLAAVRNPNPALESG